MGYKRCVGEAIAAGNAQQGGTLEQFDQDSADLHLRSPLIERFVALSETLTPQSSVAGVAEAIGTAALTLTGGQRAAVCLHHQDGAIFCQWSRGFPAEVAVRIAATEGIDSGPVVLPDVAVWPLVRGGSAIGFIVCGFGTPREWSSLELDIMLALALHGAATLERALLFERPDRRSDPKEDNARIAEALRIVQRESAQLAEALKELEAQHARLLRARRELRAVNIWLLALQHELNAERARLTAEQVRLVKALDDVASEDARVAAARESLDTQLASADQALEHESVRFAEMRRASVETRAPQADPHREPPVDQTRISDVQPVLEAERAWLVEAVEIRAPQADSHREPPVDQTRVSDVQPVLEAERAQLVEALELEWARSAETLESLQIDGARSLESPVEPAPETPHPREGQPDAELEFSYDLGGPLPAPRMPEDLYPMLVERAAELLHTDGRSLTTEQQVTILGRALDNRDGHRAGYGEHLAAWAEATAGVLKCDRDETVDVCRAARLHDLGKIGVPEAILRTAAGLTDEERKITRRVPILAGSVLRPVKGMQGVAAILRHRYEQWDGKGYPDGLQGNEIPLGARILAVVDTYGVMTTVRRYRAMIYSFDAVAEIRRCAGTLFDSRVVEAFFSVLKHEG
jgi:HD-GYP domain-containing protein (c-di-GMP phosphodiesterase class II)